MAISLTVAELLLLDSLITPVEARNSWVLAAGGSAVRCDIEGMTEELAAAPSLPAQTLRVLQIHQAHQTESGR